MNELMMKYVEQAATAEAGLIERVLRKIMPIDVHVEEYIRLHAFHIRQYPLSNDKELWMDDRIIGRFVWVLNDHSMTCEFQPEVGLIDIWTRR